MFYVRDGLFSYGAGAERGKSKDLGGKGKEGVFQGRVGRPFFSYIPVLFVQYLYLELVFVVEFKIENKMENLASGNAADIGCQYLMQGMSHTALEV